MACNLLLARVLQSSLEISVCQICLISLFISDRFMHSFSSSLHLKIYQRFSMGFRSEEFLGHLIVLIPLSHSQVMVRLALCQGALSWSRCVFLVMLWVLTRYLSRVSRYLAAFMLMPGFRNSRPTLPAVPSNIPHTMIEELCFTVFPVNFCSYLSLSGGLLTILIPPPHKAKCSHQETLDHWAEIQ